MSRKNGGIIGPANTPVGGLVTGIAGGVWRMNDLTNFVSNSQWPVAASPGENSCRFNVGDSDSLSRTPTTAGNRKTFTLSVWCKKMSSSQMNFIGAGGVSDQNHISFENDRLQIRHYNGSSNDIIVNTSSVFRDESAWYHFVVAVDTTQSTNSDRVKLYANGSLQSLNDTTYPSQDYEWNFNDTEIQYIGRRQHSSAYHFDGYMAEFTWVDGQQLTPSSFGETNSATGIWTAKDIGRQIAPIGTNGFYLNFKDSSNLGKDSSGLSNNFTVNNLTSIDQTTDITSNNYATMNALDNYYFSGTLTEGNLKVVSSASVESYLTNTMGVSKGKWYWEIKITSSGSNRDFVGIGDRVATASDFSPYSGNSNMISYYGYTGVSVAGSTGTSYGATFGTGDIIGVAMDLDNNKIYFSKNGTFQNSGDPTSGSTGTGALAIPTSPADGVWYAQFANIHNTASTFQANFGNPSFSISSGNSDANGHGNFEYAVPSGYYALNTSNLNTYG